MIRALQSVATIAEGGDGFQVPEVQKDAGATQPSIQVPGSRAKTYEGRRLFNSLFRHLVKSKCGLGLFARSFRTR